MLVKVFGNFVNTEAVGWVKIETANRPDSDMTALRQDIISVFAHNGTKILERTMKVFEPGEPIRKHIQELGRDARTLGYQGSIS